MRQGREGTRLGSSWVDKSSIVLRAIILPTALRVVIPLQLSGGSYLQDSQGSHPPIIFSYPYSFPQSFSNSSIASSLYLKPSHYRVLDQEGKMKQQGKPLYFVLPFLCLTCPGLGELLRG